MAEARQHGSVGEPADLPLSRAVGTLWATVSVVLISVAPWGSELARRLPACPWRFAVGLPCPGCGTTRALLALSRLSPLEALAWNPLAALAAVGFVAGGLALFLWQGLGRRVVEPRALPLWARAALPATLVINWLYLVGAGR